MSRTIYIVSLLLIACISGFSQVNLKEEELGKEELSNLLQDPNAYTSNQRCEIYTSHVRQYMMDKEKYLKAIDTLIAFGVGLDDSLLISEGLRSLGFIYEMNGQYNRSLINLHKADKLLAAYPEERAINKKNIGVKHLFLGNIDSAEYYMLKAKEGIYPHGSRSSFMDLFGRLGDVDVAQKRYQSAIVNYQKALGLVDIAPSPLPIIAMHQKVAKVYAILEDYDQSEEYFQKAVDISVRNNYQNNYHVNLYRITKIKMLKGEYLSSVDSLRKTVLYFESKNMKKESYLAYCALAQTHLALNNLSKVKPYLELARSITEDPEMDIDSDQFMYLQANYLHSLNQLSEAKSIYLKLLESQVNLDEIRLRADALDNLNDIYKRQGQWKQADAIKEKIVLLEKEKRAYDQKNIIYDLDNKYKAKLKNDQIQQLNEETQVQELTIGKRNKQLILSGISLFLALISIIAFWKAYITKKKTNKELEAKNSELSIALDTNKMLIKEIHHRVKNNLQVVSSLLNIQSRFEKDDSVIKAINSGKYRVQSMSILHQNLYVNEDLTSVRIKDYFSDLLISLVDGYPLQGKEVKIEIHIDDIELDVDTLVPLGLIANELVTNSLKYAYRDKKDEYKLDFSILTVDDKVRLVCRDNGPGLPFDKLPKRSSSMGMQLIQSFAQKLNAKVEIDNFQGAEIKLTFEMPQSKNQTAYVAS